MATRNDTSVTGAPPLLLRPVLALTDRIRTRARLAVVVLALLVPGCIATGMYTAEKAKDLTFSNSERDGAAVLRPALTALTDTAAGRTPDLDAIRTAAAAYPELGVSDEAQKLPDVAEDTVAARLATATALAALVGSIGNNSNLILDPDLDSFYVMDAQVVQLPRAVLTALEGASPLTGKTTRQAVAAQAVLAGQLTSAAESLRTDVETAGKNTELSRLADRLAPVDTLADTVDALATTLTGSLSSPTPADPVAVADAATAAVRPLNTALTELLETRISGYAVERAVVLAIAIGGFLLALWCAFGVLWRTGHDVRQTVAAVTAIAASDLAHRDLPQGRDEMGDIGRALDVARARLQEQETALAGAEVAREQQLRAGFLHERQSEAQFRRRTQEIIDESTGVIAEEMRQVQEKVSEVRGSSVVIDERISVADAATGAIVAQAREAEQVITSLEESLRRVAQTAALVTGIAGQTRLLALNATIEAARAGDLGYGFTVVADEVKQLATHTAESTDQITRTIDDLERDTTAMAHTITTMIEGIAGVGDAATSLRTVAAEQGALMDRLSAQMTETLGRVEQMTDLATQLERREHDRIAAGGRVALRKPGQSPVEATLVNFSAGGMRIGIPREGMFPEGTTVDVELSNSVGSLDVNARVVNSMVTEGRPEIGLQFLVTDEAMAERLAAFADRLLAVH
ncbi:methyl-accepting chemotaxis protein [Actinoplanes sp. NPDC051851]|uniref:methyl-accepting chemotaxis protein n=1 Tax=Actinoplanes sp. NPDC051851 TaxID=3154753 RepID=UPI00342CC397